MDIVFGPVLSRRFGLSLGVDLSPNVKQCNFDCVYCELQGSKSISQMREILSVEAILEAITAALKIHTCDVLTLTANGEPTLYPHLQEIISKVRNILPDSVKLLILTNGSLLWREDVQRALTNVDIVKFSCDGLNENAFKRVDRPHHSLHLERILSGIRMFCTHFSGEIVAEVLFVKGLNDSIENAKNIAKFLSDLRITRVDIGTIDRPPAYQVEAVDEARLQELVSYFYAYPQLCINLPKRVLKTESATANDHHFIAKKHYTKKALLGLIKRRPLSQNDAIAMLSSQNLALLEQMCQKKLVKLCKLGENTFYKIL